MPNDHYLEQIKYLSKRIDPTTRRQLFAYAQLHARLSELTGVQSPTEVAQIEILVITDERLRHEALNVARRMRGLSRIIGAKIKD